jgi:hypothetical protein
MQSEELIDRLTSMGLSPRAYSGRHMFGKHCVAAVLPDLRDVALLGRELRPGLEIDDFVREYIVYWPQATLPDTHKLREHQDDE